MSATPDGLNSPGEHRPNPPLTPPLQSGEGALSYREWPAFIRLAKVTHSPTPAHPEQRASARVVEGPAPTLVVSRGLRQAQAERRGRLRSRDGRKLLCKKDPEADDYLCCTSASVHQRKPRTPLLPRRIRSTASPSRSTACCVGMRLSHFRTYGFDGSIKHKKPSSYSGYEPQPIQSGNGS